MDAELRKKFLDPRWRLNNLYSIVDKKSQAVPYIENSIQRVINDCPKRKQMILKARQFGVSTNGILKMLDAAIWNRNQTCLIMAHEQDGIEKLFRICKRAYDFMDPAIRPVIDRGGGSKYQMYFPEINSRISADLESRGDTITHLHVSECAFMKDRDRLNSTLQAVPIGGHISIETTPNGMGNHFYDMWTEGFEQYKRLFFPWYFFSDYAIPVEKLTLTPAEKKLCTFAKKTYGISLTKEQINFRRYKIAELGAMFIQEYPEDEQSCFFASGQTVIDGQIIKEHLLTAIKPISDDGTLKIYKSYVRNRRYICGADTAEGTGGDYSVGTIVDPVDMEQVAVLRGHFKPSDFAHFLSDMCKEYSYGKSSHPILGVERNNHGHSVLLELEEHIGYPNIYRAKDEKLGWLTDRVTRPIMMDAVIDAIENKTMKVNDKDTLNECLSLVTLNNKIQAASGKHDDCVIALAIATQLAIEYGSLRIYDNIGSKILL